VGRSRRKSLANRATLSGWQQFHSDASRQGQRRRHGLRWKQDRHTRQGHKLANLAKWRIPGEPVKAGTYAAELIQQYFGPRASWDGGRRG